MRRLTMILFLLFVTSPSSHGATLQFGYTVYASIYDYLKNYTAGESSPPLSVIQVLPCYLSYFDDPYSGARKCFIQYAY
jgi:hypothetical protein